MLEYKYFFLKNFIKFSQISHQFCFIFSDVLHVRFIWIFSSCAKMKWLFPVDLSSRFFFSFFFCLIYYQNLFKHTKYIRIHIFLEIIIIMPSALTHISRFDGKTEITFLFFEKFWWNAGNERMSKARRFYIQ